MTITIREALQLPDMVQTKLIAGANGIDRHIRWVTIVEVLEDVGRLQEGEFLITTGFGLEADEAKRTRFIPSLVERSLSGVAIHTGFYLREIPAAFIEAANQHNLPLIEIPIDINFSTVTKAILQPIINRQFKTLTYSQAIHDQMIHVALSGRGLRAIAEELSHLAHGEVAVIDSLDYEVVKTTSQSLPQGEEAREDSRTTRTIPIRTAHDTYGSLTLTKPSREWHELDYVALQHAATLCALEFVKERAVAATEWRMQGDLVEEILSGKLPQSLEVEARSRMLGYPLSGPHVVVAIRVSGAVEQTAITDLHTKVTTLLKRLAAARKLSYLFRERSDHLILILPNTKDSFTTLNQLASKWLQLTPYFPLHIGVSNPRDQLSSLQEAGEEATFTMQAYPLLAKLPSFLLYERMEGYQFLFPFHHNVEALQQLWTPFLSSLISYDQKHGQHLLGTLEVYLRENLNAQKAAQALFIHRHTLKYRLQQIEEKTGFDLTNAGQRWQLQLAIMAYHLYRLLY